MSLLDDGLSLKGFSKRRLCHWVWKGITFSKQLRRESTTGCVRSETILCKATVVFDSLWEKSLVRSPLFDLPPIVVRNLYTEIKNST